MPLEKVSENKQQPFAVRYLFQWQPWPSATFATGNLFQWQKVAVGQGFRRKRCPTATFTIGKGLRRQRLPPATFSDGKGCHRKRLPMSISNLCRQKPLPMAKGCCRPRFLSEKVAIGDLYRRKRFPAAKAVDGHW